MQLSLPTYFTPEAQQTPLAKSILEAIKQLNPDPQIQAVNLNYAAGAALDRHGEVYGIERAELESDTQYRQRIIGYLKNPTCSTPDMIQLLKDSFGNITNVVIEPYTQLVGYSGRLFDGTSNIDGSWNFSGSSTGTTTYAQFYVDVEGEDLNLPLIRQTVLRARAAGYIPIVRKTIVFDVRRANLFSAWVKRTTSSNIDGSRNFDGTWFFEGTVPLPVSATLGGNGVNPQGNPRPAPLTRPRVLRLIGNSSTVYFRENETWNEAVAEIDGALLPDNPISEIGIHRDNGTMIMYATFRPVTLTKGTKLVVVFQY
jgi:hypothetical protein